MPKIHFERGEFLTDLQNPNSFAIYGGEKLEHKEGSEDGAEYYSLICYYNPSHPIKINNSRWDIVTAFGADTESSKCTYAISESNAFWWRRCSEAEKTKALKYLAEMHNLAWEENGLKLRKLAPGEKLCFDEELPTNARITGGNRHAHTPTHSRGSNTNTTTKIVVSRLAPPASYVQTKKIGGDLSRFGETMISALEKVNEKESRTTFYNPNYIGMSERAMLHQCLNGGAYRNDYAIDPYDEYWD